MAIVIPSSKTYDRQNPKVRDNIIERIEVNATEVVPNNEYETPIENYSSKIGNVTTTEDYGYNPKSIYVSGSSYALAVAYAKLKLSFFTIELHIKKVKNNKFISKVNVGVDKNDNAYISYSIIGDKKIAEATAPIEVKSKDEIVMGETIFLSNETIETDLRFSKEELVPLLEVTQEVGISGSSTATAIPENKSNITDTNILQEFDNEYVLNLTILVGNEKWELKGMGEFVSGFGSNMKEINGTYTFYIPKEIEITVYGNTIGIDLTDKTVYINGQTNKKVHNVDGNELMQTSNYYQSTDTNAITKAFSNTLTDYAKGKETATIRCSIGDYYDYNSGDKVISADNSTGKMSFKLYDQVIPMVYGADGKDRPMSSYKDGSAKVFEVLGSKIYYDGAVWQEIFLQEV